MKGIPVLMYHALESAENPAHSRDAGEQLYVVSVEKFERQLQWLKENGFKTSLLQDVTCDVPKRTVVLTFDDGHVSNCRLALPILQKYGCVAEFFITAGWLGSKNYMTESQVVQLSAAGMGIGTHGMEHRYLTDLTDHALEWELDESKRLLESLISRPVTCYSAPGGRLGPREYETAEKSGYLFQCSSRIGLFQGKKGSIPRIVIKGVTSDAEFEKIVTGNFTYYTKEMSRYYTLLLVKKLLGNSNYTKLHRYLSGD